jgi:glycosyltransferase involved in cell wall biosynthesis
VNRHTARSAASAPTEMSSPTVTALIDTYNYGRFVEEAIESVLAQDFPADRLEILVVDDGSTDDTRARVEKYAPRVKYLYKPNGGQASAFNFGLVNAHGDIIAFLDADDYWFPGKLRLVVDTFAAHPDAALVYHPLRQLWSSTGEQHDSGFDAVSGDIASDTRKVLRYTAAQTTGLSFRGNIVRQLLPLNESLIIDADAVLTALIIFLAPVVAIPQPLGVYRIHGENLYFHSSAELDELRQARRIAMLKIVLEEIDRWLQVHRYNLRQPQILAYRRRWKLLYETETFRVQPPTRPRFFWHLVRAMTCMNPCLNAKIQAVNALNAAGALLFGYSHYTRLDDWRIATKHLFPTCTSGQ